MKKLFFVFTLLTVLSSVTAQELEDKTTKQSQFGIAVGFVSAVVKATAENSSISSSSSHGGLSIGLSMNNRISESFSIQPSINYAFIDDESFLFIPFMAKYYIDDSFNIMFGPQGTLSLDDKQGYPINTFGLDISFGLGYDFNQNFYLEARYALEVTDRTPDDFEVISDPFAAPVQVSLNTKLNSLHITAGYRFN